MPRLKAIPKDEATGKAAELLEAVQAKMGRTPNILRTMAGSPAVLEAYLGFSGALAGGSLSPELREQIALAVGEANGCGYCVAAHAAIGKMAGLNSQQIGDSRAGHSADGKVAAALRFALEIVEKRGNVTDGDVSSLREVGYGDGEIVEIVANVSLSIFTNYFNHIAETEIDFPALDR